MWYPLMICSTFIKIKGAFMKIYEYTMYNATGQNYEVKSCIEWTSFDFKFGYFFSNVPKKICTKEKL